MRGFCKKFITIITLSIIFFSFNSCKSSSTGPDEILPGSRNYTWTVDTFKVPPNHLMTLSRFWGSSANDVWAVGFAYSVVHTIWHYDGVRWKTDSVFRNIEPAAIWGTEKNNFWIGSTDGSFWRYDGKSLNKFCDTKIENFRPFTVQAMVGRSANDIYAVGYADSSDAKTYKGIIMHYDGKSWQQVKIPIG